MQIIAGIPVALDNGGRILVQKGHSNGNHQLVTLIRKTQSGNFTGMAEIDGSDQEALWTWLRANFSSHRSSIEETREKLTRLHEQVTEVIGWVVKIEMCATI